MNSEPTAPVTVRFTPEFKRNLRSLSKKYRHIRSDVEPVVVQIQSGDFVGDRIPATGYTLFKVRVKNSDAQKGQRSGYRLIYYVNSPAEVILVTIYSKLEQSDVSANEIRRILAQSAKQ
jgi:mRNA-degrading endonuclease RelE of RelBE toxin-antitoxin system